jgi:hypothetical protein
LKVHFTTEFSEDLDPLRRDKGFVNAPTAFDTGSRLLPRRSAPQYDAPTDRVPL